MQDSISVLANLEACLCSVAKRRVSCVVEVWSGSGLDEVRQVRGDGAQQVSKSKKARPSAATPSSYMTARKDGDIRAMTVAVRACSAVTEPGAGA